ncbi:MAG: hypothetical protein ABFC85_03205 [Rectinema sp.]
MMKCTDRADPLPIDELRCARFRGVIGMCACPGASGRNLREDLAAIESWGAGILISLIEEYEYRFAGVERMPELVPKYIRRLRLPIADASIPTMDWERTWLREGPSVREALRRGGRICIHCMGGFGRTGLLAARILVEFGEEPDLAIRAVRIARPGAIETSEQEEYVRNIASQIL